MYFFIDLIDMPLYLLSLSEGVFLHSVQDRNQI